MTPRLKTDMRTAASLTMYCPGCGRRSCANVSKFTPGSGKQQPSRQSASAPRVKPMRVAVSADNAREAEVRKTIFLLASSSSLTSLG